jgi:phosphoserine phosphatase
MSHFLTLVAANNNLNHDHFDLLGELNTTPTWLENDKAADFDIPKALTIDEMKKLREKFDDDKIDIFCTRAEGREKTLFLADMDSTIVTSETLDELGAQAGLKEKIAKITERAMRGEIDFQGALKERVNMLTDLPAETLEKTLNKTEISEGARSLLKKLKNQGVFCVLVSGGFTFFTNAIADKLNFDAHHGNVLQIQDGKLTGNVQEPILDKNAKLNFLKLYCEELSLDLDETIAIGDGANDLPMLEAAGLGIGYHPKPLLEDQLLNCIRHTNLTSVLYMQGYSEIS